MAARVPGIEGEVGQVELVDEMGHAPAMLMAAVPVEQLDAVVGGKRSFLAFTRQERLSEVNAGVIMANDSTGVIQLQVSLWDFHAVHAQRPNSKQGAVAIPAHLWANLGRMVRTR